MDPHIEELYKQAKRFDEGELYQTLEYTDRAKRRNRYMELLEKLIGVGFRYAVELTLDCMDEEIELECKHYFYEGYLAGKRDKEKEHAQ